MPQQQATITHALVSGVPNGSNPNLIGGEDWDAAHVGSQPPLSRTHTTLTDEGYHLSSAQQHAGGVLAATSGTGASVTDSGLGDANHQGIVLFQCGTTATGRAMYWGGSGLLLGGSTSRFGVWINLADLSDASEAYTVFLGWNDSQSTSGVDSVMFRYTHSVNSGKWQAVCRSGSTETAADTGVTATANADGLSEQHLFEIVVNDDLTEAEFFIDGVSKATITTNIPSGATVHEPVLISGSAGSTSLSRAVYMDAYYYIYEFSTAR